MAEVVLLVTSPDVEHTELNSVSSLLKNTDNAEQHLTAQHKEYSRKMTDRNSLFPGVFMQRLENPSNGQRTEKCSNL